MVKYVDQEKFKDFKDETALNFKDANSNIEKVNEQTCQIGKQIGDIDKKATKASVDAEQNSNMMKEINFNDMQQKLRKFK